MPIGQFHRDDITAAGAVVSKPLPHRSAGLRQPRPAAAPARSRRCLTIALAVLLPALLTAAAGAAEAPTPFVGLDREMSGAERAATGVDQLTPEQRRALDAWIAQRFGGRVAAEPVPAAPLQVEPSLAAEAAVEPAAQKAAAEPVDVAEVRDAQIEAEVQRRVAEELAASGVTPAVGDEPFEAELTEAFTGWSGKTIFRLTNGQVWRQRGKSRYRHKGSDRRVRFEKNWLGGWEMTVLSSGKTLLVSPPD